MKLKGGYRTDERYVDIPDGSWVDARNILLQKGFASISNENGNIVSTLLDGQLINGVIPIDRDEIIIFSVGSNYSQIGILDNTGVYTTIIHDSQNLFKFSILNPIEGVYKRNYKGDVIAAWCDGINSTSQPPKLLNLTTLPFAVNGSFELVTPSDIILSYLFPDTKTPEIIIDKVNPIGGDLKAGDYYLCVAYEVDNNDLTNFLQISRPISVATVIVNPNPVTKADPTPLLYNNSSPGINTSVSIDITLNNLDTTFQFFRLISISKLNGIITAQEIGRFGTASGSFSYSYTGRENITSIDLSNVFVNNIIFTKAKAITDFQNELYLANTRVNNIKYQKFANNIKIKYSKEILPIVSPNTIIYQDLKDVVIYKHYQPEEIYALYIHLVLKNGTVTQGFHIPGRNPRLFKKILDRNIGYTSWSIISGKVNIQLDGTENPLSIIGVPVLIIINGNSYTVFSYTNGSHILKLNSIYTGIFGEPQTGIFNTYSNGIEIENDLTNGSTLVTSEEQLIDTNLKFHQINDTSDEPDSNGQGLMGYWENENEIYPNDSEYNGTLDYNGGTIAGGRNLIGTRVKHHKMPSENRINGNDTSQSPYIIGIRFDNIIIPTDIEAQVQGFYISYAERTMNNISVIANDILLKKYQNNEQLTYSNIYNFSLLTSKPNIVPTYLKHIYTIDNSKLIIQYPDFANSGIQYLPSIPSVISIGQILRVSGLEYHPDNNSATIPSNSGRVENISIKYSIISGTSFSFASDKDFNTVVCIANLCNYLKNVYISFYNQQQLCSTGKIYYTNGSGSYSILNPSLPILYGGDTFVNDITTKIEASANTSLDTIWKYLSYSPYNVALREKDTTLWSSYYGNHYQYNKDFSALLDIKQTSSFNPYSPVLNSYPYRVNRSNIASDESTSIGWRTFLPDRYKEMNKSKGEIWSLASLNKQLIIQLKYSLYLAQIKDRLATDGSETFLGVSDIFDREPDEIVSTTFGYIGSQSQWASFVCKVGYVVVDREQGKVFIFNGQKTTEISEIGNRNFFKKNLNTVNDIDNPFYINGNDGGGITGGYDDKNERLIFCKKDISDSELSLTMSYSVKDNVWICVHDYHPNHIFSTRNKLFFVQNIIGSTNKGRILQHNIGNKGSFYNTSSFFIYNTYIDVVFKYPQEASKIFDSINWKSEIIGSLNVGYPAVNQKDKTITHIMVYNSTQCSGIIPINTKTGNWFNPNCTNVQETWKFNDFKDLTKDKTKPFLDSKNQLISSNINNNKNWFDKSLFIDKFVVVRFIYDNVDNNDIYISDVAMALRETNE